MKCATRKPPCSNEAREADDLGQGRYCQQCWDAMLKKCGIDVSAGGRSTVEISTAVMFSLVAVLFGFLIGVALCITQ